MLQCLAYSQILLARRWGRPVVPGVTDSTNDGLAIASACDGNFFRRMVLSKHTIMNGLQVATSIHL
jgi:hypothetical protein